MTLPESVTSLYISLVSEMLRYILCSEGASDEEMTLKWQSECMMRMTNIQYSPNPEAFLRKSLRQRDAIVETPCLWKGITCEFDTIVEIQWSPSKYPPDEKIAWSLVGEYKWLPQSIRVLDLSGQKINRDLKTRFLPRNLRVCMLNSCNLTGCPDAATLPKMIEELYCRENLLSGTVFLQNFPFTLWRIDLANNDAIRIALSTRLLHKLKCDFGTMKNLQNFCTTDGSLIDDDLGDKIRNIRMRV